MSKQNKYTGFAIAIAWPNTYCKQPGAWYDNLMYWIGINRNNFYKVGHAALVLINKENTKSYYFDFGRYHAPFQHGRVRSAETDHDLAIKTIPIISNKGSKIDNFKEILNELQNNQACHGEGVLFASYCSINFKAAFNKASRLQEISPIPYGPFHYKGSNCSRFVNTTILAGNPPLKNSFFLKYVLPLTPTPINNVNSLNNKISIPKQLTGEEFCPISKLDNVLLKTTLKQPERNANIPKKAQWLSGEGSGSWFSLKFYNTLLKVSRYSPQGVIECTGIYENIRGEHIKDTDSVIITYPSNCKAIYLEKDNNKIRFDRVFV